jgi:NADH-quinone oxidoreductase subunit N
MEVSVMSVEASWIHLGPEFILLIGACAVLVVGATKASHGAPSIAPAVGLFVVILALLATFQLGVPGGSEFLPGLWLTSLTFYTRLIALGVGLLVVLVNWHQPADVERGEYVSMVLFSLLGVLLTASANDLLVLFFAVELVSIPTYVLIALSREDSRSSEAAVKYFFLGAMAAAVLAYGLSFLYGAAGTTTLHTLAEGTVRSSLALGPSVGGAALVGLLLVFAGLAFKIAAVPLHVYAADVYEGAASPVTGLLGFVPKLAGFVALIKIFGACQWSLPVSLQWMVWVVAAVTMTTGNVLGLLQTNVKRVLGYSSIAHTGYMLIALLVGPVAGAGPMRDGVAALLFYVAVYGVMNLGAFAALAAFKISGRAVETLDDLAGMAARAPVAALALAVCVFSLMGIPPLAGFLGKVYVFSSAFSLEQAHPFRGPLIALAVIGVVNSAVAAAYYLRIAATAYVRAGAEDVVPVGGRPVRWGLGLCSILMVVLFVWPRGLADQASDATSALRGSIQTVDAQLTSRLDEVADASTVVLGSRPDAQTPPGTELSTRAHQP